jgi:hypothetical protein
MVDHYVRNLGAIFAALGRTFSEAELAHVKELMLKHIDLGFAASPFAKVVVDYHTQPPPSTALNYVISHRIVTMADEYAGWVQNRKPPLFGAHPDAKLVDLAKSLGEPKDVPVLDVGAGTVRNTLPPGSRSTRWSSRRHSPRCCATTSRRRRPTYASSRETRSIRASAFPRATTASRCSQRSWRPTSVLPSRFESCSSRP